MNPSSFPSPYPAAGEVIDGKYQIERILGEGGMGCVARAYHLLLRAPVALKFMNPQFMNFPGAVERFINEGIASKKIRSDHVVPVDDVGKLSTGAPYLVMPCLEGMDLAELLARDGTPGLPTARAVHFTLQVLRGLQAAHANTIIHRDMKPSNCFVVKHDGEADFVKILDFGISKVVQPGSASLTQTNSALGTPLYMSPEQARSPRDVDSRSDLYSVGVILYELLTGHTPFSSDSGEFTEILFKLFTAEPPPVKSARPDLDDALAAAVHKALARDPDNRFATPAEMAEAIAPFADERSTQVLSRMRAFKPEQILSMPPPANMPLPPSLVAFSKLDARPATDVMANRPTTDVMRGAPVTEALSPGAVRIPGPAGVPNVTEILSGSAGLEARAALEAHPPIVVETHTKQADAAARTLLHDAGSAARNTPARADERAVVPGAQTDLGASRDTGAEASSTHPAAANKRSPLVFALPALAVVAIAAAGFALVNNGANKGGNTGTNDRANAGTANVVPPAGSGVGAAIMPAAPPSATTEAAASASASPAGSSSASATPSASVSAVRTSNGSPSSKPAGGHGPGTSKTGTPGTSPPGNVDALDIGIKR